jgi:hypothetical protein
MLFASDARPALLSHLTVAGFTLAAVFCAAPALAQSADRFTLNAPAGMVAEPVSNRQFDTGYGVRFADGSIPVAGTSTYPCQIGFKFNAANNHLSRAEINQTTSTAEWRTMVRGIIGMVFAIQGERGVTVQGYKGLELKVMPKAGPGAETVRGLMTMVETPKGRMTSVCMTTATAFPKAEPRFRALPRGARLPE